jgi:hypothetical protein
MTRKQKLQVGIVSAISFPIGFTYVWREVSCLGCRHQLGLAVASGFRGGCADGIEVYSTSTRRVVRCAVGQIAHSALMDCMILKENTCTKIRRTCPL